ncbi:MAG TPA: chloride channel protein [Gemmatimonadaceae bacterium]|jgi:CIC family chloride channel protein|nr:chloride channel protein [Gemmatimonadaceae bacterium]
MPSPRRRGRRLLRYSPWLQKSAALVREDMMVTYARDVQKWIWASPILGIITGLLVTGIAAIILDWLWPAVRGFDLAYPAAIVPTVTLGFIVAGLIMQYGTPDPNEHSTVEVIRAYHERGGKISMRPFIQKLTAAIATVGLGGSAALEGPGIYSGGALGSWLWTHLRRFGMEPKDRRILVISGAAAGMSAVFRAPLTGIMFALEMPFKDDLAHEAVLPSLIASVVSYATMSAFMGSEPLFDFPAAGAFTGRDLAWSALLGAGCGLVAMAFTITFRRFRHYSIHARIPHWCKMGIGGALTGLCGLAFVSWYHSGLIPLGPNYEAADLILRQSHGSAELVVFAVLKMLATMFSLGVGGVSSMFVPLFLTGGSLGTAFAQSIVHSTTPELFAAVGMASFIAAGYKTPLTAVIFVAEATGGHAFIIPSLIGAAVAYGVSGEASASTDQRVHQTARIAELAALKASDAMRQHVTTVQAGATMEEFSQLLNPHQIHTVYPVLEDTRVIGTIALQTLSAVPQAMWKVRVVRDLTLTDIPRLTPDATLQEALQLLTARRDRHLVLVVNTDETLAGILTTTDILKGLEAFGQQVPPARDPVPAPDPAG